MKFFAATRRLAAATALISLLAVPALADPPRLRDDPREPAIARLVKKALKRFFGISTTGDYPTVPRP
jgi:hypothetical protein